MKKMYFILTFVTMVCLVNEMFAQQTITHVRRSLATITSDVTSQTECEADAAQFAVTATIGSGTLSYAWEVSTDAGATWTAIVDDVTYSGASTATLDIIALTNAMNGYQYRCNITTSVGACEITTAIGTLTVRPLSVYTVQPSNQTACENGSAIYSTTVSAPGGVTYQWNVSTDGGTTWTPLVNNATYAGVTNSAMTVSNITPGMDDYYYSCDVTTTLGGCVLASSAAKLDVNSLAVATSDPADQTVCEAGSTTFTAAGTGVTGYQWQVSTDSAGTFANITASAIYTNVTTATLGVNTVVSGMDTYQYRCRFTSAGACYAYTSAAVLNISLLPTFASQAINDTTCEGSNATFSIVASIPLGVSYVWQRQITGVWTNITDGGVYMGATTPDLILTGVTLAMNGDLYRCVITDLVTSCSNNSNTFSLTVNPLPTLYLITVDGVAGINGEFCDYPGATGNVDGLSGSQLGYTYQEQLALPPNTVLDTKVGTGGAIQFAPQTEGQFRIIGISTAGCQRTF